MAVVIVLANRYGDPGALVLYGFAWAVFVVPFAVLAVPIATSAFPELSAASDVSLDAGAGSGVAWAGPRTASTRPRRRPRAPSCWRPGSARRRSPARGSPLARVFESHSASSASVLAVALVAFAPGLVGYGLSANLSRVLYALGRNRAPALAMSAGWLLVIVADLLIVPLVPRPRVVPALGLGTSIGLTVAGLALLILVRRERGAAALAGSAAGVPRRARRAAPPGRRPGRPSPSCSGSTDSSPTSGSPSWSARW